MFELLQMFVDEVNKRNHLASLLKDVCITVKITVGHESVFLVIENEKLSLIDIVDKGITAKLTGNQEMLNALLFGEIKLRDANRHNWLKLESTFRTSLLLESLFKLAIPIKKGLITENVLTIEKII